MLEGLEPDTLSPISSPKSADELNGLKDKGSHIR